MAVTIKDITKRAKVSYPTVSRALNGVGVENMKSRKSILRLAQEVRCIPNQTVINLKKSRSYIIGLYLFTIGKMTSPFMLHDVLTGVYSVTEGKYNVVVKSIGMHEPGTLGPGCFDKVIALSQRSGDMEFMNEVPDRKIPMTVICRAVDVDAPDVTTDEVLAMEQTMNYLLENGHRNIGIIEGNPRSGSSRLRRRGQRTSMTSRGLGPNTLPVTSGNYRYAGGCTAAKQLLAFQPTALLCFNGEMAFGTRTAIVEVGLRTPNDVSLVDFDNWDMSSYSDMHLTTVERNMGEIAEEGARVLLRRLGEGIVDDRRVYLSNKLIIRNTVRSLNVEERRPSRKS